MPHFILALLRALTTPDGPGGELLSTRRKFHLLQAEWYARLAAAGEAERKAAAPRKPVDSVPEPSLGPLRNE